MPLYSFEATPLWAGIAMLPLTAGFLAAGPVSGWLLTGHSFFPSLISAPFAHGLQIAFDFSIACCLVAAVASLLRGKHYVHDMHAVGDAGDGTAEASLAAPRSDGLLANKARVQL